MLCGKLTLLRPLILWEGRAPSKWERGGP